MNGLCVSITPEGKLKRHLSVKNREVPLEDTTVGNELILFVEERPLKTLALLDLYHSEDHFKLLSCDESDFHILFRSVTQYYTFLIQRFLISEPNVARCELCGKFFLPKTKRRTLYCDRIIRDGKTCKQLEPYLKRNELARFNHVVSEFNHVKDRLLRRLERTGYGKKPSPIDLTEWQYLSWLEKATLARDQFLAGEISENEALSIIHVPTKKEMMAKESADCTLDFSFASSYCD